MTKIRKYPDPVLRIKSDEVKIIDKPILNIVKSMKENMALEDGIGLAANQIGITKRIILIAFENEPEVMLNPEIIWKSDDEDYMAEGCLSFENLVVEIKRKKSVKITYTNLENQTVVKVLDGIYARVAQHEIDHLNGILIVDYLEPTEKLNYNINVLNKKEKIDEKS